MRGSVWLGSVVAAALQPAVAAASPFETLDPYPAASLEVSSAVDYARGGAGVGEVILRHGAATGLGENLEASITFSHGWTDGDGSRRRIAGEPAVAVKWRFHEGSRSTAAIEPALSSPSGHDGLRLSLPVGIAWRSGRLGLRGALGYDHVFADAHGAMFTGVLATYALADHFTLGVELAADAPVGELSDPQVRGNVGFIWAPTDRIEVHGLAGRSLATSASEESTLVRLVLQAAF
ncbi:hypothetical protein [Phenylobacterium sp.]|uniref:hypothetical protein n=1 Tax=Phenylobacterium sp. TaxID=1871053 RepID=UPI002FC7EF04